jgi:hypothetical protein
LDRGKLKEYLASQRTLLRCPKHSAAVTMRAVAARFKENFALAFPSCLQSLKKQTDVERYAALGLRVCRQKREFVEALLPPLLTRAQLKVSAVTRLARHEVTAPLSFNPFTHDTSGLDADTVWSCLDREAREEFIVEDMELHQDKARGKLLAKHDNAWYRFCIAELELARLAILERDMARFTKDQLAKFVDTARVNLKRKRDADDVTENLFGNVDIREFLFVEENKVA